MNSTSLSKKAKKKVQAKMAFYTCSIVFATVTVILLMIGYILPSISQWLIIPIPVFLMILTILYINTFGLPTRQYYSDDWQQEEIEREMIRLHRETHNQRGESTDEMLHLEKLELVYDQSVRKEDFV